jgi:pimeloyl-ACP methyl ester carboxylesterase
MLHGGHMRAALPLGEDVFADADYTVLAPSRPGYGRTSPAVATGPDEFAEVIAELCGRLGIARLTAVVGQSAGGPTAVALASRCPDLVERLILQSAVGVLPWPGRLVRLGGRCVFGARVERVTWALIHALVRRAPDIGLHLLLRELTLRPARPVVRALSIADRAVLVEMFTSMRSGSGFAADLRAMARGRAIAPPIEQPTLIIAARDDRAVPIAHAHSLEAAIPGARLVQSQAPSHFIWFAEDYPALAAGIAEFLGPP